MWSVFIDPPVLVSVDVSCIVEMTRSCYFAFGAPKSKDIQKKGEVDIKLAVTARYWFNILYWIYSSKATEERLSAIHTWTIYQWSQDLKKWLDQFPNLIIQLFRMLHWRIAQGWDPVVTSTFKAASLLQGGNVFLLWRSCSRVEFLYLCIGTHVWLMWTNPLHILRFHESCKYAFVTYVARTWCSQSLLRAREAGSPVNPLSIGWTRPPCPLAR